jgi:phosphoglycolate phosphatase-like HAD superfamily hydrolase
MILTYSHKRDVLCAANAGIQCAALLYGKVVPEWTRTASYHLRRLTEIIAILEGKHK